MRIRHQQRSGAVLLLSLLMMAAIVASTIGVSILITSDFNQSRTTEQFVRATLAADAGIERGLAVIQAGRLAATLDNTVSVASGTLDSAQSTAFDSSSSSTLTTQTAVTAPGSAVAPPPLTIPYNQTATFDVLKTPAGVYPGKLTIHADVNQNRLRVVWAVINRSGTAGQGFTDLVGTAYSGGATAIVDLLNVFSEGSNSPLPFDGTSTLGYRIYITALDQNVSNLVVQPTDSSGATPLSLYSTIQLQAVGRASEAVATKQVTVLWQRPTSGVFSYVLFTEGDIKPEP